MNKELIIDDQRLAPVIPSAKRDVAVRALRAGDIPTFFKTAGSEYGLPLLYFNIEHFKHLGLYEQALLYVFTATRANKQRLEDDLGSLFYWAARQRLRDAGQPLPDTGPFMLYRGVAGRGQARRIYGYSWTPSIEIAQWFADRAQACYGLHKPGVYRILATEDDVLAYINDGKQEEFIIHPGNVRKPLLVCSQDEDRIWRTALSRGRK